MPMFLKDEVFRFWDWLATPPWATPGPTLSWLVVPGIESKPEQEIFTDQLFRLGEALREANNPVTVAKELQQ